MNSLKKQISYLKRKSKIIFSKRLEKPLSWMEKKRIEYLLKKNDNLILIYTIGKVGSASVYKSLKQTKELNFPIFHLHTLNPNRIEEQKKYYSSSVRGSLPFHLIQSSALMELLPFYKGKIYIFTLIREPIQREISSIFQDSFNFTMSSRLESSGIEQIVQEKMEKLFENLPENQWFEKELKQVFGFDVFSDSFDFSPTKNYAISNRGKSRLALVRLENLNQLFSEVCQQLFNVNAPLKLVPTNLSDEKFYKNDYTKIKEGITFSERDIEKTLCSKFIQKFYPDQISTIKTKMLARS